MMQVPLNGWNEPVFGNFLRGHCGQTGMLGRSLRTSKTRKKTSKTRKKTSKTTRMIDFDETKG
jgi:hypothetical protein